MKKQIDIDVERRIKRVRSILEGETGIFHICGSHALSIDIKLNVFKTSIGNTREHLLKEIEIELEKIELAQNPRIINIEYYDRNGNPKKASGETIQHVKELLNKYDSDRGCNYEETKKKLKETRDWFIELGIANAKGVSAEEKSKKILVKEVFKLIYSSSTLCSINKDKDKISKNNIYSLILRLIDEYQLSKIFKSKNKKTNSLIDEDAVKKMVGS